MQIDTPVALQSFNKSGLMLMILNDSNTGGRLNALSLSSAVFVFRAISYSSLDCRTSICEVMNWP